MDRDKAEAAWQVWHEASKVLHLAQLAEVEAEREEQAAWSAWMLSKDLVL